jgi:hypothetical protein
MKYDDSTGSIVSPGTMSDAVHVAAAVASNRHVFYRYTTTANAGVTTTWNREAGVDWMS